MQLRAIVPALAAAVLAAAEDPAIALDAAVRELPGAAPRAAEPGAPVLRLLDISLAVVGSVGTSTAEDEELEGLKAGGHDPHRRGFNLQAAELALSGAVDPYFTAAAQLVASPEHGVELEEAYITTSSLPYGLEARVGYQLIEFGRVNPSHLHSWTWLDQPVIASRLLGAEGSRSSGARLAWLLPAPWYSQLLAGVYNADDGTMVSFQGEAGHDHEEEEGPERTVGGRLRAEALAGDLACLLRWENAGGLGGSEIKLGLSWLTGPAATGEDERSDLLGADLVVGARPSAGPFSAIKATVEAMWRRVGAPASQEEGDPLVLGDEFAVPAATLTDWGLYAQVEVDLGERWRLGLRGEYATADGDSVEEDGIIDHDGDAMRDTRIRVSPLIAWRPSEFSRLRLQYDWDRAEHLVDGRAHSIWLGLDVLLGAHPAHGF